MYKRALIIMMILFALLFNLVVSASDKNIITSIAPYVTENGNRAITRGDCVAAIMKLISVDKEVAYTWGHANYDQCIFIDVYGGKENDGYIFIAKESNVAVGVELDRQGIGYFKPNREVTVKECLTFMLRCLKDYKAVEWENTIPEALELGLLLEEEAQTLNEYEALTGSMFKTLLERMLNMNRYLYWPDDEPLDSLAKTAKVDEIGSMRYIDWILERENIY